MRFFLSKSVCQYQNIKLYEEIYFQEYIYLKNTCNIAEIRHGPILCCCQFVCKIKENLGLEKLF